MTTATVSSYSKNKEALMLFISAALISFVLFYIDEGFYDFRWMKNLGNWIAFAAYILMLFIGQLAVSNLLLRKYHGIGRLPISIVGGTLLVFLILFTIYSIIR